MTELFPIVRLAAGITLGAAAKRWLGLHGLAATVNECETWRKDAAWITPGLTDEQRRISAQKWNTQCRDTVAATATTAAAAITQGYGGTDTSKVNAYETQPARFTAAQRAMADAEAWLRSHRQPVPADFPAYVVPVPVCGPLDADCLNCTYEAQKYNQVSIENAQRAYTRAEEEYDCYRNKAAGHPERCNQGPPALPLPPAPACSSTPVQAYSRGGAVSTPTQEWVAAEPGRFPAQTASNQDNPPSERSTTTTPPATSSPAIVAETPEVVGGGLNLPDFVWPQIELPGAVQDIVNNLPLPEALKGNTTLLLGAAAVAGYLIFKNDGSRRR